MAILDRLVDFFVHKSYFEKPKSLRQARLIIRSSLLTSVFSNSYLWLSFYFEFDKGVYLMTFNVIGFLLLPLFLKTKTPIKWIGNLYVAIGALAVIILAYYSGGLTSGLYPWIISIPILAVLIVDRYSGMVWALISLFVMTWFGWIAYQGMSFPIEYNQDMHIPWFVSVLTGLLLIIFVLTLVFEYNQSQAVKLLELRNKVLIEQKEKIANQTEELKSLLEEKDYTTHILAHDLKNPLANIQNLVDIVESENSEEERKKFISLIKEAAQNSQELIKKVLDVGLANQENLTVHLEEFELVKFVKHILLKYYPSAEKKFITVSLTVSEPVIDLISDKTYIRQILENLISNAIKFSNEHTQIDITLENKTDATLFLIADQGPGLSKSDQQRMFGRYTRLTAKPTAGESSSGLGLSIVKRLSLIHI